MSNPTAAERLIEILTKLQAEDKMFHLDDDPAEFDCFTAEEATQLKAELDSIRNTIGDEVLWDIAADFM